MIIKSYNRVRIKEEQFFKNAENIDLKFWNEGLSKKAVKIYGDKEAIKYRRDNLLSVRVNEDVVEVWLYTQGCTHGIEFDMDNMSELRINENEDLFDIMLLCDTYNLLNNCVVEFKEQR
jgi:hypothetical protein